MRSAPRRRSPRLGTSECDTPAEERGTLPCKCGLSVPSPFQSIRFIPLPDAFPPLLDEGKRVRQRSRTDRPKRNGVGKCPLNRLSGVRGERSAPRFWVLCGSAKSSPLLRQTPQFRSPGVLRLLSAPPGATILACRFVSVQLLFVRFKIGPVDYLVSQGAKTRQREIAIRRAIPTVACAPSGQALSAGVARAPRAAG